MDPSIFYGRNSRSKYPEILTRILRNPEDSEDSQLEESDEEEPLEIPEPEITDLFAPEENLWDSEDDIPLADILNMRNQKSNKITWNSSRAQTIRPIPPWKGTTPSIPESPGPPFEYFRKFIDSELLDSIVHQTNLFACQRDPNKPIALTVDELERFIGITFIMSIYGLPRTRMFWQSGTQVDRVTETMSRNRWEQIKTNLHFNNNDELPNSVDKLFKIRPLMEKLVGQFNKIAMTEKLCVDEQMIPFKGRHHLKQYMKNKPRKWGYKAFVLCGSDGVVYNWDLYCGSVELDQSYTDVGISGNVVMKLAKIIPRNDYYKIYYDNWFNSPKLQVELSKHGILSLGTVRCNRLGGCTFSTDKEMRKRGRGTVEEKRATIDGVELTAIKWYDNKPVHLLSSFSGVHPMTIVKRWDNKAKTRVDVNCPQAVTIYNQFMGGVDLVDSLIALYRTNIRSKKWYHKIYFHLMDLCVVNSWLLYRRDCDGRGIIKKNQLSLLQFKTDLANTLCSKGLHSDRKRGRPSSSTVEQNIQKKRQRGKVAIMPTQDVRKDNTGHWPIFTEKRGRCKYPDCAGVPKILCSKCGVHLCFTPTSNCFYSFHNG